MGIVLLSLFAGAAGGVACFLLLARDAHDRVMTELEDSVGFQRELLDDNVHAVNHHYLPLRSIQRGNFAGVTQWHCYSLGINLRSLRPALVDDPKLRQRAEQLKREASALLSDLEQSGTCLAPGGVSVEASRGDD